MTTAPEDRIADLIVDSICGRLTEATRQELSDWCARDPGVARLVRETHDPVIASREMALFLSIDWREGYRRWQEKYGHGKSKNKKKPRR